MAGVCTYTIAYMTYILPAALMHVSHGLHGLHRPTDRRPATDRPTDRRPATDRPATDRPATDRPATGDMQNAPGARPPGQGRAAMGHGYGAVADNFLFFNINYTA
jgi:hypothetical protein